MFKQLLDICWHLQFCVDSKGSPGVYVCMTDDLKFNISRNQIHDVCQVIDTSPYCLNQSWMGHYFSGFENP